MSAVADEIWAILKENSLQIGRLSKSHEEFKEFCGEDLVKQGRC